MADYIRRQAEGKLHLFWPAMRQAFFAKFPEHVNLGLPLPTDQTAPKLTDEELAILKDAIESRKSVCDVYFAWPRG
jgi:hypothetical protein